jgi:hypothetical protein
LEDADPPDFSRRLILRDDRRSEEADGDSDHDPISRMSKYSCPEELAA